jgi:hypothetical protein
MLVHRLVLEAFVSPCPPGMECRHLDGNPSNPRLDNLKWGTRAENVADTAKHGTRAAGERHGGAKLTTSETVAIRAFRYQETVEATAARFGVSKQQISRIQRGERWPPPT